MKKFENEFENLCKLKGKKVIFNKIKHLRCLEHRKHPSFFDYEGEFFGKITFSEDQIDLHHCKELMELVGGKLGLTVNQSNNYERMFIF